AGPVENVLLAGAAWLLAGYGVWDLGAANLFFRANLGLALFNLLPGLPLDGGRVLRALLSRHLPWRQATELTARLGQAWGALLVCLGAALYRERLAALSIVLLGGFLWTAATAEQRWAGLVLLRYLAHKRARLAAGAVLTGQPLVAAADTELRAVGRALAAGRYHLIWVVDKEERLQGLLSEAEFTSALLHLGPGATLGEALARRK
ncbi:MAG TPA: peptidase M50, partial [Firmicutes bacterium]|nr:peptidase M50 [Bacillota bacterium]